MLCLHRDEEERGVAITDSRCMVLYVVVMIDRLMRGDAMTVAATVGVRVER